MRSLEENCTHHGSHQVFLYLANSNKLTRIFLLVKKLRYNYVVSFPKFEN